MMSEFISGRIAENKLFDDKHCILRVSTDAKVNFIAGQFNRLALDIDGELVARAYSFVNAPSEPTLEFYANLVPEGVFSKNLIGLRAGDEVMVSTRPSGFLTLDETPDGDNLWLLATGTGVGPFISLLRTGEVFARFRRVVVVHAVRYASELNYDDELRAHCQRQASLQYLPIVSRETVADTLGGRIPQAIAENALQAQARVDITPEHSRVLLCGNPAMIVDTSAQLAELGLRRHRRRAPGQILTEKYWS